MLKEQTNLNLLPPTSYLMRGALILILDLL